MTSIYAGESGTGIPVILIHGFPFNSTIWNSFAQKLSQNFRVITPDLPGFGQSALPSEELSIDSVGEILVQWLREKGITRSILIGHSLGGYVVLSMAKIAPEMFEGIGLFHSTAGADSAEKKESRNKVIEFIDKNGVEKFTSNFISPLFADQQHPAINTVREIAVAANEDSVKAYVLAMRDRADSTGFIGKFAKPVLFIAGVKDAGIPVDSVKKQAALNPLAETHILPDAAHMGMVESENQTVEIVRRFIEKVGVTSR